jgi:serine/threonine protein kinase
VRGPASGRQTYRSTDDHEYVVLRELGAGGQGRTLLVAREGDPQSRYVLKLLHLQHVDDWKQVELFEREVSTLAALAHPGIPRLHARIVEDGRTAGIVQSYVEGHTVATQIAEHGPLSPARFEALLRDALEILAYLQAQVPAVLHRDINPKNVMIGADRAYVVDFGAVRVGGKTDMTSVGTFGYMAPEQIIGRPGPASDMYGLGMTFVSLAERRDVGDLPIDSASGQVDRGALLRGVEPRVRQVVLGMIEPGLRDRLADPKEALHRLDAPPVLPAVTGERSPVRRSRAPVVAAVAIGALVVGGIAIAVSSAPAPAPAPAQRVEPAPPIVPAVPPARASAPPPAVPGPPPVVPAEAAPPPVPAPRVVPAELTEATSAELRVRSTPADATVSVDGVECKTPCTLRVAFGEHQVTLQHEGRRVDRTVNVLEDIELAVSLSRDPGR